MGGGSGRDSSSDSFHHSGRHRSSSNSMDGDTGKAGKAEKSITSPNRFEKLENLDPDVDDSVLEPSSSSEALKGSSRSSSKNVDSERKRDRDRSSGGNSSIASNHRGRKGNPSTHHKVVKGHSSEPETIGKTKNDDGNKKTGKTEHESGVQEGQDTSESKRTSSCIDHQENDSELNESKYTDTSVSLNSKYTSLSTSGIEAGPSHESLSSAEAPLDLSQDAKQAGTKTDRISYSRVS